MALQCGIVGLPNVGKSTLFNCLSNAKAQSANFPFCTIEPNVGVITVPDERLNKLAEIEHPQRVIPTTVEIVDIDHLIEELPERRRVIFNLSRKEHKSYKEIAFQLNISEKTVENQISEALKFLKKNIMLLIWFI